MHKLILVIIISHITLYYSCAQVKNRENIRESYSYTLNIVYNNLKNGTNIEIKLLESIIPTTKDEFDEFYQYRKNFETKKFSEVLYDSLRSNAYSQKASFFNLFILMSEFVTRDNVDDEFLTDYYYDLDFMIDKNSKSFCELYEELDNNVKDQLAEFYNDYCK